MKKVKSPMYGISPIYKILQEALGKIFHFGTFGTAWKDYDIYEGLTFKSREEVKKMLNLNPKEGNMIRYEENLRRRQEALRSGVTNGGPETEPSEPKHGREVCIQQIDNGFIIKIGCATFVETCRQRMFSALCEYWSDPDKAAKKYYYNKQKK